MSNPRAKAERSKAKDARQMPAPDNEPRSRSKKGKPVVVEYRWIKPLFNWGKEWSCFGKYRDVETAEDVIKKQERKYPGRYEMRIRT